MILDLSDLTGDAEPVTLDTFLADNEAPGVEPLDDGEVEALRGLAVGGVARLSIGGGHVVVRRVS